MPRNFRVKINGVTLPGAGMMVGATPGARQFAHEGESVTEEEIGPHLLDLFDSGDERTHALFDEVEPTPESDDPSGEPAEEQDPQGEEPIEGYDKMTVKDVLAAIQEANDDPDLIESVKQYESLSISPRKTILEYEPEEGDGSGA